MTRPRASNFQEANRIFEQSIVNRVFIKDPKNVDIIALEKSEQKDINQIIIEMAIRINELSTVKYLIKKNERIQKTKGLFFSKLQELLVHAIENGHLEIVEYLVDVKKANIYHKDQYGSNALYFAVRYEKFTIMLYLIEQKGVDIYQKNNEGRNVLHHAAFYGKSFIVQYLINKMGMDIYQKDNQENNILHIAAWKRNESVLKYLIEEQHMDIHQKNNDGNTILHHVAWSGQQLILEYLIKEKKWIFIKKLMVVILFFTLLFNLERNQS